MLLDPAAMAPGFVCCPNCATNNPADRKFCGGCGGGLREPCLRCTTMVSVDETFCGSCGANLPALAAEKQQALRAELNEAGAMLAEARFDRAASLLRTIAKLETVRLRPLVQEAQALLDSINAKKQELATRIKQSDESAQAAFAASKWTEALAHLQSIPATLQTVEQKDRLEAITATIEEITRLRAEVKTGLATNQTAGLLGKVQRLSELQPDSAKLKQLIDQLTQRLENETSQRAQRTIASAKALLKKYEYEEACRVLEDLPDEARTPEVEKLCDYANELGYLYASLRRSTFVEPSMLAIGQRLLKHAPGDARSGAIVEQLKQRAAKKKKSPWETTAWAKAPAEPALGFTIEPLSGFGAIDVEHLLDQPLFVEQAGRLHIACGLALQGVDLAAITTNLRPNQQRGGMLGQLSTLVRRKKTSESAWGIDLSASGLKAVKLSRAPKTDAVKLESFDVVTHAQPIEPGCSDAQRGQILSETLARFCERNPLENSAICIGMPGPWLLGRFITLPPVELKRLDDLIQYEAKQQVPFPLADLEWDYHTWFNGQGKDATPSEALLIAAKHYQIQQRLSFFAERKLEVQVVQCDSLALYNFFRFAHGGALGLEATGPLQSIGLLDVGADATNFIACHQDRVWFRSFARGGDDFTKGLVRRFQLSFAQAEQLKLDPLKSSQVSKVHDAWSPALAAVRKDIVDSTVAYSLGDSRREVKRVFLSGGSTRLLGLTRHLLY